MSRLNDTDNCGWTLLHWNTQKRAIQYMIENRLSVIKNMLRWIQEFVSFIRWMKGVSIARNKGLEVSTGEYVMFVGSGYDIKVSAK